MQSTAGANYIVGVGDTGMITIAKAAVTTALSDGGFTYDGTTEASGAPKLTATVVGQTVDLDSSDIDVTNDDVAAGDYVYQLNSTGLAKVQSAAGGNYTVAVGDAGTITIAKSAVTTILSDGGFTYDGTTKASGVPKLTASVVGQTVDLDSSDIDVTNDDVAAGDYVYQLNSTGLAKVQSAVGPNYTVGVGDTGTITITPASITTTLSDGGFTYDGTTKASGAPKLTATVVGQTVELDSSDVDVTDNGSAAGDYVYQLNANGLEKVQSAAGANYIVRVGDTGTITIAKAPATTTLSDGGFTYDGTTKASGAPKLTATVVGQTVELDSSDIDVINDAIAVGSYDYQLNATGLAKVQSAAGGNYTVGFGDAGTITITPASITTTLSDGGFTYDGTTKASGAPKLTATVIGQTVDLDSSDIDITNDATTAGNYDYQLNATGLAKVQSVVGPNYTVVLGGSGTVSISQVVATTVLSDGGFTFDGTTKASEVTNLTASVVGQTVELDSDDIIVTDDGSAAGDYVYQLNSTGLAKVQSAAGPNYTVAIGDVGTITIAKRRDDCLERWWFHV
ncbi:beta strand repeat-containing protein [Lacticaseibacillus thailandensis]|uniref:beta strand repeat-containing protein n=1 Tax=Lacticaseibacillus thailandensis TaxID=381741 RepID=UPI001CDB03F6|nr:MBG domain-containing protein [Lacticaseibacillus thailandensis]